MAAIINADDGVISGASGLKLSSDTSGALNIQTNGVTAIAISASQVVSFPATTSLNFTSANITTLTSSSATITNLLATTLTVSSVGIFPAGSASSAAITTVGDTNTGIFFPAADTIAFTEGGVEAARFNSSGDFGVGETSPDSRLEVAKAITFANIDTFPQLCIKPATGSTGNRLNLAVDNSSNIAFIQSVNRGVGDIPLVLQRYAGNVGIGTTTPTAKLNISGTSNAVGLGLTGTHSAGDTAISIVPSSAITGAYNSIYSYPSASTGVNYTFGNSNTSSSSANSRVDIIVGGGSGGDPKITYTVSGVINWCIGVDNSDSDAFKITTSDSPGTNDRFTIATNGVVGSYATSGTGAQFSLYSNGQTTVPVTLAQGFATATDNIGYLYNRANAAFVFGTNNTERARILSGGEFLVGRTSTIGSSFLCVQGGPIGWVGTNSGVDGTYIDWLVCASYAANTAEQHRVRASISGTAGSSGIQFMISDGAGLSTQTESFRINRTSCTVVGALSKGSGSFKIDHPLKPDTHQLVHSFIEGPQADLIYSGKVQLEDGKATVNIDVVSGMTEGTFVVLCRDIRCFTNNETDWDNVRGKVIGNLLTIECQNPDSDAVISWMVIGERQDKHMYDTEWTDENGKVIVEPEKHKVN